jgi:hypothetical protein
MVHLVNYQPDEAAREVRVDLHLPAGCRAKAVTLASPDRSADLPLRVDQEGDIVRIAVPEVRVYEIAVVDY